MPAPSMSSTFSQILSCGCQELLTDVISITGMMGGSSLNSGERGTLGKHRETSGDPGTNRKQVSGEEPVL